MFLIPSYASAVEILVYVTDVTDARVKQKINDVYIIMEDGHVWRELPNPKYKLIKLPGKTLADVLAFINGKRQW